MLFSEPKIPQFKPDQPQPSAINVSVLFSEPKIPQLPLLTRDAVTQPPGFSALQRAENSSISVAQLRRGLRLLFQCSSASRKFLNRPTIDFRTDSTLVVSVLFSEPKIPQCCDVYLPSQATAVSVLFSEPKIPQFGTDNRRSQRRFRFSALQRAENSSIDRFDVHQLFESIVSVLFSEPKIPQ